MGKVILPFMTMAVMLSMLGCQAAQTEQPRDLVVAAQTDSVRGGEAGFNDYCTIDITVEPPVDGPRALTDSVMAFVNKEVYEFCEFCSHEDRKYRSFSSKRVFVNDGRHLLSRYMERYAPIIKDSLWNTYFSLQLAMESQTGSFVTYGLEHYHCGGSCGSEKCYYTFNKKDGHKVQEVINHEDITRFFEDYPEYRRLQGDIMLGWPDWEYSRNHIFEQTDFGLGHDGLLMVISDVGNHFYVMKVPYGPILSYLSKEAQELVEGMGDIVYPSDRYCVSDDGEVWMEVDTVHNALVGHTVMSHETQADTLVRHGPELTIYPKNVHTIHTMDNNTVYLIIYSQGNLIYWDEAIACTVTKKGLEKIPLFEDEGHRDSLVSCMWYDQLVEVSDGFPYDSLEENRFGIHYDWYGKRLYVPVMEHHEDGSEFENCLRYTGRFYRFSFNGCSFIADGTDGAWWLRPELRGYKRTLKNHKTAKGYEQIDLMPDGYHRRAVWKGAKTLDDLRKKPDVLTVSHP